MPMVFLPPLVKRIITLTWHKWLWCSRPLRWLQVVILLRAIHPLVESKNGCSCSQLVGNRRVELRPAQTCVVALGSRQAGSGFMNL